MPASFWQRLRLAWHVFRDRPLIYGGTFESREGGAIKVIPELNEGMVIAHNTVVEPKT